MDPGMWARLVSLFFFIGGWTGIIAFVFGLPGHIDDATTWLRWLKVVQELPALLISIGMVVTGPILWTSGLWCPRVVRYVHERNKSAEVSMSDQSNEDLVRFKDCLSHIKRCRKLIRPYAQEDKDYSPSHCKYLTLMTYLLRSQLNWSSWQNKQVR